MSFSKALQVVCIGLVLVTGVPVFLYAGDPPHNEASGVSCSDCHGRTLLNDQSPFWTDNKVDSAYNAICLSRCHTIDSVSPYGNSNAPPAVSHAPGGTVIKCTVCHHNHDQDQIYTGKNNRSNFFLAKGAAISAVYDSGSDTTTITYSTLDATDPGSYWAGDLSLLAEKTDDGRGGGCSSPTQPQENGGPSILLSPLMTLLQIPSR